MKVRTFKCYQKLYKAISRNKEKIDKPGKMATLFLETFLHNNGSITRSKLETRKLIEEGQTMEQWRNPLIRDGWIVFEQGKGYQRYYPGQNLISYINEEKMSSMEIATTKDVQSCDEQIRKELKELRDEFSAMKQMVGEIITEKDPPWTEEKEREWIHGKRHLKVLGNQPI